MSWFFTKKKYLKINQIYFLNAEKMMLIISPTLNQTTMKQCDACAPIRYESIRVGFTPQLHTYDCFPLRIPRLFLSSLHCIQMLLQSSAFSAFSLVSYYERFWSIYEFEHFIVLSRLVLICFFCRLFVKTLFVLSVAPVWISDFTKLVKIV